MNHCYCINPICQQRQNSIDQEFCQSCGTALLIKKRYRLLRPLRPLDPRNRTDVFEVDDQGTLKVMKVLLGDNPKQIELLKREARTLQLLEHPGIPKVEIDGYFTLQLHGNSKRLSCLVMEKIEGQNLEEWVEQNGPISQDKALQWMRQLINILTIIHSNQLFHRDIKPSNIMLKPDNQLVLIDFDSVREITDTYLIKIQKQEKGTQIISAGYSPPEQVSGMSLPQSDFYALGRTFVYLVTGKRPHYLPVDSEKRQLIWRNKIRHISPAFLDFIDQLIAVLPEERPPNVETILQNLSSIQGHLRIPRWIPLAAIAGLSVTAIGLGGIALIQFQADRYFRAGIQAQDAGNLQVARSNYERSLQWNPKNAVAHNNLAVVCENNIPQTPESFDCAKKHYKLALSLEPTYGTALYNLASLYANLGQYADAEKLYKYAIIHEELSPDLMSNWARLQLLKVTSQPGNFQAENLQAAIRMANQGLQKTKDSYFQAALYRNLGWARFLLKKYPEAEKDLQQALKRQPKMVAAHCLLAQVREAKGDRAAARLSWVDCLRYESDLPEVKRWKETAVKQLKGFQ